MFQFVDLTHLNLIKCIFIHMETKALLYFTCCIIKTKLKPKHVTLPLSFTFVACILLCQSFFYRQLMHKTIVLKNTIKIYIKTSPTCFGVITIIRERTVWAC